LQLILRRDWNKVTPTYDCFKPLVLIVLFFQVE